MENLLLFVAEHLTDDISRIILDRKKYPEIDIDLAVNCIESRRKLRGKVQQWCDNPNLIFPLKLSAEQCSSSATGQYKRKLAEEIAGGGKWTIADLTGGLGVDSWFFSQSAEKVIYNEMQEALCKAARHNFQALERSNIVIKNHIADSESLKDIIDERVDIVYLDPARRGEGGKKVFLIEDCTPDVLTLKDIIFTYCRHILIKLSPMADISMVCSRLGSTCRQVHVVATGGECKELLVWMDREWNDEYTVIAAELHGEDNAAVFAFKPSEEKSAIRGDVSINGPFLFEPGKALMKAAPYNLISTRWNINKLGHSTHYYTTGCAKTAEDLKKYGKVYEILEYHPLDKRSIKAIGSKYPKAEVTARNIPMDTDTLRKKSGVTSGDDAHIFGLKSDLQGNLLIAAKRII